MKQEEIEQFGRALAEGRKRGTLVDLRVDRVFSDEDAWAIQTAAVEAYDDAAVGYSLQATSALSRRILNCAGPIFTPLLDGNLLTESPFRLPQGVLGAGCVFEFVLGRPYPMDGEEIGRESAQRAVVACRLGIEILGRRVRGSLPLNDYTAIADFGLHVLLVQGPRVHDWHEYDIAAAQVAAKLDGQVVASGRGSDVMGHPLEAVAFLARALAARGRELEPGEIVVTGTCTGLVQVLPGQRLQADFGAMGAVDVSFE